MRARQRAPAPAPAPVAAAAASAAADALAPAADTAAASAAAADTVAAAAAAPDAARRNHTRFDYMKHDDVVSAARRQRGLARQRRWEKFRACAKLAALRARASTWRERAGRAAGCGELRKLLDEITLAYQRGHFKVTTHVLCVMELRFLPCAPRLDPSSSDRKIRRALFRMASSASAIRDDVARAPLAAPRDLLPSPFRQGKRTMFHFLQDMVHSVAAEPNKNGGRVSIHWHEVVLCLLFCLRFF